MSDAKILIVEDKGINAMELESKLEIWGYPSPFVVFSGEEAIQKALEIKPDLILMDISLEGEIDGIEVIKQINNKLDIPVIYITTPTDEKTMRRAKSTEHYNYMVKPFGDKELKFAIEMAIFKHRANKKLKESEKQLRLITDNMLDRVGQVDTKGVFQYISPSIKAFAGYDPEDLIGKPFFEFIHPDDLDRTKSAFKRCITTPSPERIQNRFRKADGDYIWVETIGNPLLDDEGQVKGAVFSSRAISEQKKIQEELHNASLYARGLIEASLDPMVTISQEGKITDVNKATELLTGVCRNDLIGKDFSNYFTEPEKAKNGYQKALFYGSLKDYPLTIRHNSGRTIDVLYNATVYRNEAGEVQGIFAVARDITDLTKAEKELKSSEKYFRSLIENALDVILVLDDEGNINYASPSIERIFGYKIDEIIGYNVFDFVHPEDAPDIIKTFNRGVRGYGYSTRLEARCRHEDGSWRFFEIVAQNLLNDPAVEGVVVNASDITERKKIEKELKKSEKNYRTLVENINDVIFTLDTEGNFTYISPVIERISGYKADEIIGQNFTRFMHPEDVPGLLASMKRTLAGQKEPYEFRVFDKDGDVKEVRTSSELLVKKGQIVGLSGIMTDITKRKKAEEALKDREKRLRLITDNMLNVVGQIDSKLIFQYITPSVKTVLGYDDEDILGKNTFDLFALIHPEDLEKVRSAFQKAITTYLPGVMEYRFKNADGHYIWLDTFANPLFDNKDQFKGIVFSAADITDRKKIEEALKDSEAMYRSFFENTGTAMVIIEEDTTLSLANTEFERLSGYSKEEIEGKKSWTEFVVKDDLERMREYHHQRRIDPEAVPGKYEFRFIDREGEVKDIFLVVDMIPGTKRSVASLLDITERKKAEDQIKRSLKEKEVFLREIHHRVKNNMQIILSLINLQSGHAKDKETIEMFEDTKNRIRSMALVHEKLYESESLARINFEEYIRNLVFELLNSYRVDPSIIKLKIDVEEVLINIDTAIPCALIINELVSNSLKHAFPDGGCGEIRIKFHSDDERFTLIVSDSGVGFPEELDFRNTETLGLQLVCTLTAQLGGSIELDRSEGTSFKIIFKETEKRN